MCSSLLFADPAAPTPRWRTGPMRPRSISASVSSASLCRFMSTTSSPKKVTSKSAKRSLSPTAATTRAPLFFPQIRLEITDNSNISEQLIEKGLATVLRHKRDDEDRSTQLDKLIIAEQAAVAENRGLHSNKEVSLPRIVDASESGSRASQYLPSWKRAGRHAAIVDFVASGSRFKVTVPKENAKMTFVLAGIRAPRTARNPGEKSEAYGPESLRFASRYMQRDVEIAFDSTDKQGGFIGAMYAGGANVAVELVKEG